MASSPVTSDDLPLLSEQSDLCTRFSGLIRVYDLFREFLDWLLDDDGNISDDVLDSFSDRMTPIGAILMFATHTPPSDKWLVCQGQAVSRTTYEDLFNRIGTTFGVGDTTTTFNLPDLRDRFPVGYGSTYGMGSTGGEATHVLTVGELPAHTHANGEYSHVLKAPLEGAITGVDTINSATEANVETSAAMLSVGSNAAHENRPPYLALQFMIKAL